jgi:methylmalonyl-CoA mutase
MAAMLGGTQSLHTNALDEAIALPTEFSARIARNTQIVIQEETGMTKVVDPLGGSYYIEALTAELVDKAWEIIERVEAEGGMAKAVAAAWPKAMIEEAAAARQARVDKGEDVIVGVNKYRLANDDQLETLEVDNHAVREAQIARLKKTRATRDEAGAGRTQGADRGREGRRQPAGARGRGRARARHAGRNFGRDGSRVRPPRHRAAPVKGVYGAAYAGDEPAMQQVHRGRRRRSRPGPPPRMLVAKMGQDGHDRGANVIASAFADMGFDVDHRPAVPDPGGSGCALALENDVDAVGASQLRRRPQDPDPRTDRR